MATAEVTSARGEAALPSGYWWLVLLEGVAAVIIGILLLTDPGTTLVSLMVFLGIWWFIGGIFDLVRMFIDHHNWGWRLASGVLGIVAGLVLVQHPFWSAVLVPATLVWLLGGLGIVIGAMSLFRGIFRHEGWGTAILGVLSILFGVLLLGVSPLVSTTLLTYMAGFLGVIGGIVAIVWSFRLRRA